MIGHTLDDSVTCRDNKMQNPASKRTMKRIEYIYISDRDADFAAPAAVHP